MESSLLDLIYKNTQNKELNPNNLFLNARAMYGHRATEVLAKFLSENFLNLGNSIWLPELICNDLVDGLKKIGCKILYYPVNDNLVPDDKFEFNLNLARVCLFVNYFGKDCFHQKFEPFRRKEDCLLVEDNTHGLFSKDNNENILGLRGDISIFSPRKTISCDDGGILIINSAKEIYYANSKYSPHSINKTSIKKILKKLPPRMLRLAIPYLYKIKPEQKAEISQEDENYSDFLYLINSTRISSEVDRRRKLFVYFQQNIDKKLHLWKRLEKFESPYTFPFVCSDDQFHSLKYQWKSFGVEMFSWPDLPIEIKGKNKFYDSIRCVRFLW